MSQEFEKPIHYDWRKYDAEIQLDITSAVGFSVYAGDEKEAIVGNTKEISAKGITQKIE